MKLNGVNGAERSHTHLLANIISCWASSLRRMTSKHCLVVRLYKKSWTAVFLLTTMDPVPPTLIPEGPPTPPPAAQARILQQVIDTAVNRAMSTGIPATVDASVRTALSASSSGVPPSSHAPSTGQNTKIG